jgi:hypothetical protein
MSFFESSFDENDAHHIACPSPSGPCWRVNQVEPDAANSLASLPLRVISGSNWPIVVIFDDPLAAAGGEVKYSMPAWRASSTMCRISGRSTTGSISLDMALVAGRNPVPRPATGKPHKSRCIAAIVNLKYVVFMCSRKTLIAKPWPCSCPGSGSVNHTPAPALVDQR